MKTLVMALHSFQPINGNNFSANASQGECWNYYSTSPTAYFMRIHKNDNLAIFSKFSTDCKVSITLNNIVPLSTFSFSANRCSFAYVLILLWVEINAWNLLNIFGHTLTFLWINATTLFSLWKENTVLYMMPQKKVAHFIAQNTFC